MKRIFDEMKKAILLTVLLMAGLCTASSEDIETNESKAEASTGDTTGYETLLAAAKSYETEGKFVHALGTYWDAIEAASEEAAEAVNSYWKLASVLMSGKPGYGEFDEFGLYDGWASIYADFESYWAENILYVFNVSRLEKGKLDMASHTATYNIRITTDKTEKYKEICDIMHEGVKQGCKTEWQDIPRNFDEAIAPKIPSLKDFAFQLDIADADGNLLFAGTSLVLKKNYGVNYEFAGVDRETIKIIDAGGTKIVPSAISRNGKKLPVDSVKWNIRGGMNTNTYAPGMPFLAEALEDCVNAGDFYIMATEVTQLQYLTVTGSNPSVFKGFFRPVENVSWYEAMEFCNKLSELQGFTPCYSVKGSTATETWGKYQETDIQWDKNADGWRLPTKEEWMFAAREGTWNSQYKFSGSNNIDDVAWYGENSGGKTHEVATKKSNALGLYDMTGNVSEWGWDTKDNKSSYDRVYFGGHWNTSASSCSLGFLTTSARYHDNSRGVRLVRSVCESDGF